MSSDVEKRSFPRRRFKWSVTLQTSQGVINTETHNISVKGAYLRSWEPFEPGEIFKMFINVPTLNRPLLVDAEVVWTSADAVHHPVASRGMGVQFIKMSSLDRSLLNSKIFGSH